HWLGEFYGEFGTFDVTLDVPPSYIVGATGEVVSGDPGWEMVRIDSSQHFHSGQANTAQDTVRRIVTFHAKNVHDFMWVASPDFFYQTGFYKNIPIHILYQKSSHEKWHNNALNDAKLTLAWLEDLVGEYAYPVLTICQGIIKGGMEYPTLAILGEFDTILLQHEIAHAYFYGALANNEQAEGWLDEGITTYQNELFINKHFPNYNNQAIEPSFSFRNLARQFKPIKLKDLQLNSLYYYFYSGFDKPLNTPCYKLNNLYLYLYHVYYKPSKFFAMLDYLVGRETFIQILHKYYEQCKFTHVNSRKFQVICEQVAGMNLDWFFKQWIDATNRIDFACSGYNSRQQKDGTWKTDMQITRLGNGILPVEIEAITSAGDSNRIRWDGKARHTIISLQTNNKVKKVRLDPDDLILDQNRLNNTSLKIKVYYYPEFPSMHYLPRNAYTLFLWPQAWYNDIDGVNLGLNVFGGYLNRYYVTRNSIWYGARSHKFHYKLGFSSPWERIDNNLWRHFSILNIEGRREIDVNLSYNLYKAFASQQSDDFRLGFVHQKLTEKEYGYRKIYDGNKTAAIQEWDPGDVNKFYFSYSSNYNRWVPSLFSLDFTSELSSKAWNSNFDFVRLALKYQLQLAPRTKSWRIIFRNFLGYTHHEKNSVPIQSQFWIAEGNPNQRFKYYYLRSPGSVPAWLPYHLPGDGNLRGYYNKMISGNIPLTANQLATANVEFIHRNVHNLLPKFIQKQFSGINFCLFFDGGAFWDTRLTRNALFDAGFGFRFHRQILYKERQVRIDFPLWLSHPNIDNQSPKESHWKFRWIVSFQ
ncbi:MAG TPA: M1 family aminopeptidase, partial [bacterium]